ncbi:MAG: hypothetical protein IT423_14975, partial [Pirellulaceae bacterium]|nr:hypothetical protein [Pirellulaceae bacterium]
MWNLAELKHRWKAAAGDVQRLGTLPEYRYLADELLSSGAPLQALEVAEEGCAIWADDLELACIKGRALARSGSSSAAAMQLTSVVDRLRQETTLDRRLLEEAVGVLARTEKDQAFSVHELAQRQYHL